MRVLKNILSQLHVYVLWLLLSTVFWGWIFTSFVADTSPEKKITIYIDAPRVADTALDIALEEHLPRGIRMVRAHPFSYAVFDTDALLDADIFIVPASRAAEYIDSFAPLSGPFLEAAEARWERDGTVYGLRVYDAETGASAAGDYITYAAPGQEGEDFYLFIGSRSLHAASFNGSGDDAALETARAFLLTGPG